MCQQWISLAGLLADMVGFLMIVSEWRLMFQRHIEDSVALIDQMYARLRGRMEGLPPEDPHADEHWSMGRHMYDGVMWQARRRGRLVYIGAVIIISGLVLQAIGTWPGGVPWTTIRSC